MDAYNKVHTETRDPCQHFRYAHSEIQRHYCSTQEQLTGCPCGKEAGAPSSFCCRAVARTGTLRKLLRKSSLMLFEHYVWVSLLGAKALCTSALAR